MLLSEKLLQYIWRFRIYQPRNLLTVTGEPLQVLYTGIFNTDAGPDFLQARIKVKETLLAGHVEVHLRASDWYRHHHPADPAYKNVILHVVYENDRPVTELAQQGVPTLELQQRIPRLFLDRYEQLMLQSGFIPCGSQVRQVGALTWLGWKDRLVAERLQEKTALFLQWLEETHYDWEMVFYRALARSFGQPVNADIFEELAGSLSLTVLRRHRSRLIQLEALLFGQAGFLEATFRERYPLQLQQEYRFLRKKYRLAALPVYRWKWLRMRPSAFPVLRIAQFAMLLYRLPHLFSGILEVCTVTQLQELLQVPASSYWDTRYRFEQPSGRMVKRLGTSGVRTLIINAVVPLLLLYGRQKGKDDCAERALSFLRALPPEQNRVIAGWRQLGVASVSAWDTQALLQLKKRYCNDYRCLDCSVGIKLLKR